MKVKKIKIVNLVLPFICMAVCFCLLFIGAPTKVFADDSGIIKVGIVAGGVSKEGAHSIPYPTNIHGEDQTVFVSGYRGSGEVIYSVLKEDSGSYIFNQFEEAVEITEENSKASFSYNFFQNGGVGTYRIKAVIMLNGEIINHAQELRFTIQAPTTNALITSIQTTQIGATADDFPEYQCDLSVVARSTGEAVDLSSYTIEWFYNCNGKDRIYCGSGETIKWSPKEVGVYQLFVEVPELGIDKPYDVGEMTKNFSTYAIIGFSAFAVLLTAIVVGTTINKVKKERIW